ncbi:Spy/CpxP family protein refolding chaperone [Winogradskyella sp. PE311]|uniref:Spy/CpxP family protein refolding chaperone n=1 Tax=Winogradskyella sp. PE311 TaxID=3366943 RepID=UPI00397FEC05
MKKLVIVALALFTINGMAQQERRGKKERKEMAQNLRDMSPKDIADLKSKKLTLHLDLSESQQKQVHNIILAEAKDMQKMREERKADKSEKERPSREERLEMQNNKLDKAIAMKRQMKTILTPEQYAKFEKMKPSKRQNRSKRGKKRD